MRCTASARHSLVGCQRPRHYHHSALAVAMAAPRQSVSDLPRDGKKFDLLQLDELLVYESGEVELKLKDPQRRLIHQGLLKREHGRKEFWVFLLDNVLLVARPKTIDGRERLKVKYPIPLGLLVVSTQASRPRPRYNYDTPPPSPVSRDKSRRLCVSSLGKRFRNRSDLALTLLAPTTEARNEWIELVEAQQEAERAKNRVFDAACLNEHPFGKKVQVNCAVPYDNGRKMAYGTTAGVYFQTLYEGQDPTPIKVLDLVDIWQIDVLEDRILVLLSKNSVLAFPLDDSDPPVLAKRMERISSRASYFSAGYCLKRTLICVVKTNRISSTVKVLEPINANARPERKRKSGFGRFFQAREETFNKVKEFSVPAESYAIHFLKTKLCIACTKGFEILDLESLDIQALLDPADTSLDFVQRRSDVRPLSIYQIGGGEFLLCYTEFAFYADRRGWRSKKDVTIYWQGTPTAFALHYPYVLAFDPRFIEIRHVEDGTLVQVIRGNNIRCLFADNPPSRKNGKQTMNEHRPQTSGEQTQVQKHTNSRDSIVFASDGKVLTLKELVPGANDVPSAVG